MLGCLRSVQFFAFGVLSAAHLSFEDWQVELDWEEPLGLLDPNFALTQVREEH
jgi:hypothetical protein